MKYSEIPEGVEINRPPDEDEKQLATPPHAGKLLKIDGLSISEALDDPQVGPALEELHDYLQSSDRRPDDAGRAIFILAYNCFRAGHPIREYPTLDVLAPLIRDRVTSKLLIPLLKRHDMRGMSSILYARTLRGTRTLAAVAEHNAALLKRQWKGIKASAADWDVYVDHLGEELSRHADKYDPTRGSFATYVRKAIKGAYKDFKASLRQTVRIAAPPGDAVLQDTLMPDGLPNAETAIILREKNAAFTAFLSGLDDLDREIAGMLTTGRHGDLAAFGKLRSIPEGTLWSRVSRLKRKLKEWISGQR